MRQKGRRAGALLTVVIFTAVASVLLASALKWSSHETRLNHRHILRLEAQNAAESILEDGIRQVQTYLDISGFSNNIPVSIDNSLRLFLSQSNHIDASGNDVQVQIGAWSPIRRVYIDPNDPNNRNDDKRFQTVLARNIDLYSMATARDIWGNQSTSYCKATFQVRTVSGLSNAIYYNMDLELHPGPSMRITGPIHVNGDLYAVAKNNLYIENTATMTEDFIVGMKLAPDDWSSLGGESSQSGTYVKIKNPDGDWTTPYKGEGETNHGSSYYDSRTFTNNADWVDLASQRYNNNIRTDASPQMMPGIPDYIDDNPYTTDVDDDLNYGYTFIEPTLSIDDPQHKHAGEFEKIAYRSGLTFKVHEYTPANPADMPKDADGNIIDNAIRLKDDSGNDTDMWISAHKIKRNPPAFGIPQGFMPPDTISKQVQAQDGFGNLAYKTPNGYVVYDDKNTGTYRNKYGEDVAITDPSSLTVHNIDIHEVQEKNVYIDPAVANELFKALPYKENGSGDPISSFYDKRRQEGLDVVQLDTAKFKKIIEDEANESSNFLGNSYDLDEDYNGVVYFQFPDDPSHTPGVDKIKRSKDKMGLLMVNNNELPDPAYNQSGAGRARAFVLGTNNTIYTKGHFNADGTITDDSPTEADDPDNPDIPAILAADAITILSENWDFSNSKKLTSDRVATNTEFSGAIICGLMPTDKNGSGEGSGGSHNFPRFLEKWSATFAYRGSLIALFESEIATEPWHTGYYSPPTRKWGYYDSLGELSSQGGGAGGSGGPGGGAGGIGSSTDYIKLDFQYISAAEWNAL